MFVVIDNIDKNAIEIEGMIQRTRNKGEITPEFAMEILSLTNHRSNIKKLVRSIKDKCKTKEDILPYREFIVSCVEEREVSEEALADLREMATLCGCEKEFEVANGKPKFYGKFDCNNTLVVKSREEFDALEGENLKVYFDADLYAIIVDLSYYDLSKVKALKFREGAKISLRKVKNLPEYLDVSMCAEVDLSANDLSNRKGLKFRDGAKVILRKVLHPLEDITDGKDRCLPDDLDLSMCSEVELYDYDLSEVKELRFREGAKVTLCNVKNLPHDLDVYMCDYVSLRGCCLSGLNNIKFKEDADADLSMIENFPEDIDVSMCRFVSFNSSDLSGVKELKFKEGAEIDLYGSCNLPRKLDFSMCEQVDLFACDLTGVEEIKFKDEKQKDLFMQNSVCFDGKFVYEHDENKTPLSVKIYKGLMKGLS